MSWLGWILRKLKPTTIFIRLLFASSISKMDKVELRKEATIFVVPVHKNKVKAVYVKRVIEIIEEYGKS